VTGSPRNLLSLSTTITFEAADLREDVVALVDAHLLDLGGTSGDPNAGDPIQSHCFLLRRQTWRPAPWCYLGSVLV